MNNKNQKMKKMLEKKLEQDLSDISIIESTKDLLRKSLQKKQFETNIFFQRIKDTLLQDHNTFEEEEEHRKILKQNFHKMIKDGEKMLIIKKETTPFHTMILQIDEEDGYFKLQRNKLYCLDGQKRINIYDYLDYLIQSDIDSFQTIFQESPFFTIRYEKREHHMLENQLKLIQSEYSDFYESMSFFHQKEFIPIHHFILFIDLKL
jgi:hypothetical protein